MRDQKKEAQESLGGHVSHGGRDDLNKSETPELPHAERLIDEWREAVKFSHLPTADVDYHKVVACGQRLANYVRDAEPQSPSWQPIETAPKDGTWLLVIAIKDVRNGRPDQSLARWSARGRWITVPGAYAIYPTHWMPLPAPPVDAKAEGR